MTNELKISREQLERWKWLLDSPAKRQELLGELRALLAAPAVERQEPVDLQPIAYMRNEGTPNNLVKCTFTCPGAFGVYRSPPAPAVERQEPVAWKIIFSDDGALHRFTESPEAIESLRSDPYYKTVALYESSKTLVLPSELHPDDPSAHGFKLCLDKVKEMNK